MFRQVLISTLENDEFCVKMMDFGIQPRMNEKPQVQSIPTISSRD